MPDQARMMELAKAMGAGGAQGGAMGALTGGIPNGVPGMMAGMKSGGMLGAAVPLARHMFPSNPDAAQLLSMGAMMPFPLNVAPLMGGALMMGGAKPTRNLPYASDAQHGYAEEPRR